MTARTQYKTKQMSEILSYLKSNRECHVTVSDITRYFSANNIKVGTTTVYRHLERLVEQGAVAKFFIDGEPCAVYEYTGKNEPSSGYIHCKCQHCGNLLHIECSKIKSLEMHLDKHHHFMVDSPKTVLYGICSNCKRTLNT